MLTESIAWVTDGALYRESENRTLANLFGEERETTKDEKFAARICSMTVVPTLRKNVLFCALIV